jgi:gliding motility-associated-like protein
LGTGWGASSNFKDFWEYDPATDTWLQKADAGTTDRYEAVGFSIGSKGYICTGGLWPVYTKDLLEYDPAIDCWIKRADFGGAVRALASGFAVGGKGYVGTSNFQVDFWEYTPAATLPPPIIASFSPSSGIIGTSVIISGTNFDTAPSGNIVKFNGVVATVTASNSTSITVIVPNGATTGIITVATGCNAVTSATNFTVTPYVPFGNVVQLNGTNNLVVVADNIALQPQSLTLETWVNFSSTNTAVLVGKPRNQPSVNNSYAIYYAGGALRSIINVSEVSFPWTPTIGNWNHVAVTYDNTTQVQKLYLNGVMVGSSSTPAPILYSLGNMSIGSDIDFGSYSGFLNGKLDEVRLWNAARTQSEIASTINSTLTGNEPNLVGYYKMDEVGQGAGITAINSATSTGATLNGTTVGTSCTPIFTLVNVPAIASFSPTFGNTGASITITGTNFDPALANNIVKFNGAMATVMVSTATSITATVPAGGSSGPITVQVGCNTGSSSTNFIVPVCFPANGQNADVVLGQTNFTSSSSGSGANKISGNGGIAIHHASGKVFITDVGNNRVLRFSASAAAITGSSAEAVLGQPDFTTTSPGLTQSKMNLPIAITIDQNTGTLWVTDANNHRILRFDNAIDLPNGANANGVLGQPNFITNTATPSAVNVGFPFGVALDSNGDLWVGERAWNRVTKFANAASLPNGAPASVVLGQTNFSSTSIGTSASTLWRPNNVVIDILGNLWVADELNDRVLKFPDAKNLTTGAAATVVLGQTDFFGNSFATSQNRMYGPIQLHADLSGNLWVGDWANQRALQFVNAASLTNGANASKVLGAPDFNAIYGGTTQNRTSVIAGIAVDKFGNVYVGDGANRILRFNAPIATVAGVPTCSNTSVTLTATGAVALQEYRWYDAAIGGTLISSSASFTSPTLTSDATYYVSLFDGACSYESTRVPVIVTVNPLPAAPAISNPAPVCTAASVTLTASGGADGDYRWYDAGSLIAGEVNSMYTISNLSATKTLQVSIFDGTCEGNKTSVTVTVQPCNPPVVAVATTTAFIEGLVTINLEALINDEDDNLDPSTLQITEQPASGAPASLNGFELTIDYTGFPFTGSDRVGIEACDLTDLCTEQQITIELGGDVTVFNGFSPNGDGLNEFFKIQYIDILPESQSNKVFIYNRWGDEVFSVRDYNNDDRVFNGESNNGKKLSTGTYFYKIVFSNGKKTLTGFLELKY